MVVFFKDHPFESAVAALFVDILCAKARLSTVGTIRGKTMPGISLTFAFYTHHCRYKTVNRSVINYLYYKSIIAI